MASGKHTIDCISRVIPKRQTNGATLPILSSLAPSIKFAILLRGTAEQTDLLLIKQLLNQKVPISLVRFDLFMIEHQLKLVETVINIFNTVKYIRCK
jgi:hypothetical protein